ARPGTVLARGQGRSGEGEAGGQAVPGESLSGEEVIPITIIKGDGDGSRGKRLAGTHDTENLGQRHDAEFGLEHPAHLLEASRAYREVVVRYLVGHAVNREEGQA